MFAHSKTSHDLLSYYTTSFAKVQTQCWCRILWRISVVKMSCSTATGPEVPCCWVWLLPLPLGMGKLLTDTFTNEELSKINPLKLLAYRTLHTSGLLNLCQSHHLAKLFKYTYTPIQNLFIKLPVMTVSSTFPCLFFSGWVKGAL